jgi:hypothetical protein
MSESRTCGGDPPEPDVKARLIEIRGEVERSEPSGNVMLPMLTVKKRALDVEAILEPK